MKKKKHSKQIPYLNKTQFLLPYLTCFLFFLAYAVFSIVRHAHYQSFGFDLGINDQVVWRYSTFQLPITTIDHIINIPKLFVHVEFIYALLAPFYWLWKSAYTLLLLEPAFFCLSGIPIYLLARKKDITFSVSLAILFCYLAFYGVQNAIWFDVHSASFGAAFLGWFLYFLEEKKLTGMIISFLLAIGAKENIAGFIFLICITQFIRTRDRINLIFAGVSLFYLFLVFGIYFHFLVPGGYRFQSQSGLFSGINPLLLFDTHEKRQVFFYSLFSYAFLPLLSPITLIPFIGNLASYFILGRDVSTAQGLYLQYRIGLAPLLGWSTIVSIQRFAFLNKRVIALFLIIASCSIIYLLHLPMTYLAKSWFWTEPSGVQNIEYLRKNYLPSTASVVSQNNITPHISERDKIYTLYPETKQFSSHSPCNASTCDWFRWEEHPAYLFVDTSPEWDTRHLLTNRDNFLRGLKNLEKAGVIIKYQQKGSATLYKVLSSPNEYK